jgi:hypothetical protein
MHVYMFASRRDASTFAFTHDPTGSNLPPEFAPWHALGIQVLSGLGGANGAEMIRMAIEERGSYVVQAENGARSNAPPTTTISLTFRTDLP